MNELEMLREENIALKKDNEKKTEALLNIKKMVEGWL